MKHRSIWFAALVLAGTPLCAMAFDYGPNSPLLAAETGAPQLPVVDGGGAAGNDTARPDVAATAGDTGGDAAQPAAAPEPQHMTPSGATPHAAPVRAAHGAVSRGAAPAHAATAATATSWQSLLPGSIQ